MASEPRRRSPRSRRSSALPTMIALVSLTACHSTTRVGDRFYERGRFKEAAAAYEVFLDSEPGHSELAARSLYRIGLIFAMPDSDSYDPVQSIVVLDRLISEFPNSLYAIDARILRDLQQQIVRLDDQSAELRQLLAAAEEALAERRTELATLLQSLDQRDLEIQALQSSIPSLEGEIRTLIRQLAAKEQELEKLEQVRAIDLADAPP